MYLNLYKQVYFPDCALIQKEFQNEIREGNDFENDSDNSLELDPLKEKPKSVGIVEEEYEREGYGSKNGGIESKKNKMDNEALIERINYEVVGGGFHHGEITSMDICI
jgi:hypothetical protein